MAMHDETDTLEKLSDYFASIADELSESNTREDLLVIPKNHVAAMEEIIQSQDASADIRGMLRHAVFQAYDLNAKDLVLFMNGKMVVRYFKRTEVERRFEGLPKEEIKKVVDELYSGDKEDDMVADLDMIMSTLTDTTLDFKEIDNVRFNAEHIKIIQKGLMQFYATKFSYDDVVIKAIANYIFRESFYYIHELLAENLLELIEYKNKNAETFLRYYNGSTYIQDGQKYITPEIIDEDGDTWNIAAIVNFISQFAKNKTMITKKEDRIRRNRSEKKSAAKLAETSEKIARAAEAERKPSESMQEKIIAQLEENRQFLEKNGDDEHLESLSPERLRDIFEKSIRDMNKRVDFLHTRIEGDLKTIEETQERYTRQQEKYDMLIIAISEVLMDRKTPAMIKD